MSGDAGQAGGFDPGAPSPQDADGVAAGDVIDRIWGPKSPTVIALAAFVAAAVLFGGAFYAVTGYGPTTTEPATVVRQYYSSSGAGNRSACGIEVQVASGEKTKATGDTLCAVYDEGDQAVALVSTITGDAVGVRHAGRDFGRSGNPLVGFAPLAALVTLVSTIVAAARRTDRVLAKTMGAATVGAVFGLVGYWLYF